MTIISDTFEKLRQQDRCALIPFITAGDPDLETTAKALRVLDDNGADFIELGFPYSDPLADGPVIHAAATRALKRGTRLEEVLEVIQTTSSSINAPIILFTYYNPILNRGIRLFVEKIARMGVEGLIVPDLPIEEASHLLQIASEVGIEVTLLVAPTSSPARIKAIATQSGGFIYLVSVTGVTGVRSNLQGRVKEILGQMRLITDKPIGVGFGISSGEQAQQVKEWGADAVIVGSAFVQRLATGTPAEGLEAVGDLCRELKTVLDTPKIPSLV